MDNYKQNNNSCEAAKNYASIQQAYKKNPGEERKPVSFTTPIQAVYDGKTDASLEAILAQFNSIYVQYQGTPKDTRLIIPKEMRRAGLTITYMDMESNTITERANSAVQKDNGHWALDVNWSRVDELSLSGDISVSAAGTWIINGKDTGVKALGPKGDTGLTPWLKTIENRLHFSYDNITWEPCSENIAAWFRWSGNKIQISRDNKTWTDLSGKFADNIHIKGYVASTAALPSGAAQGDIYGVGPTYAADDTAHTNPIYRYYVRNANEWVDNGSLTSISAGVVQETGDSETEVMSQKAVSAKLSELGSEIDTIELNLSNSNVEITEDEVIWSAKGYIATSDANKGDKFFPQITTDYSSRAFVLKTKQGQKYKVSGLGETDAVSLVVILDNNNIVIDRIKGITREVPLIVDIPCDGTLCVNLFGYNSSTDSVYFYDVNGIGKKVQYLYGSSTQKVVNVVPDKKGYINTSNAVIGELFVPSVANLEGCVCYILDVPKGSKVNIRGIGDTEAVPLYVLCDKNNIVQEKYVGNTVGSNGVLHISRDSKLYINMLNYDSDTCGVTIYQSILQNGVDEKIDGIVNKIEESIIPNYWTNGYINTSNATIGSIYRKDTITQAGGINSFIINVKKGEQYRIAGLGDTELVSLYVLCDKTNKVLDKFTGQTRSNPACLYVEEDGTLYVNLISYDAQTDYINKIVPTTIGGYRAYYNSEKNNSWSAKTMICFGDSITEFAEMTYNPKRYSDYIAAKTGASVFNVGIGGSQIAQRATPTTNPQNWKEAYAGLDICNMVKAWATHDFSIVESCANWLKTNREDDNLSIINTLKSCNIENVDIVTIFAGTNDFTGDSAIGNKEDADDGSANGTIWGSLKYIIKLILSVNPSIHIYIFTPIVRYVGGIDDAHWCDNYTRIDGNKLSDIADVISDIARYNHIPCNEWYYNLGWNQHNFNQYFTMVFGGIDEVHPYRGFEYLADKMIGFLKYNGE